MDELIGRNLVALRSDMTQKALADAMRERGHKWSQATVWALEKGDRPLKLTEAKDLVEIVGGDITRLLRPPKELSYARIMQRRYNDWYDARAAFIKAATEYEEARLQLRQWMETGIEHGQEAQARDFAEYIDETAASLIGPIAEKAFTDYRKRMSESPGGDDGERSEAGSAERTHEEFHEDAVEMEVLPTHKGSEAYGLKDIVDKGVPKTRQVKGKAAKSGRYVKAKKAKTSGVDQEA